MQQTDVSSVVVAFQAAGALLLALVLAQLVRIFVFRYARMWAFGWASLAVSLVAMRLSAALPYRVLWLIYLLANWLFLYLLWNGCREATAGSAFNLRRFPWVPLIAVAIAAALVSFVRSFNELFMIDCAVTSIAAGASWLVFRSAPGERHTTARHTMRLALGVFAFLYAAYVPLFEIHTYTPLSFLTYASLAGLLANVLLGCAMIVVTAEAEKRELNSAVSALAQAQGALEHRLQTDPLTEVLSRHAFHIVQDGNEVATAGVLAGTVVMIDVDDLKTINDEMGHAAGDVVIRAAANAVRLLIRADDMLFRFGGDEFVAIMPNMGLAALESRFAALDSGITARSEKGFEIPFQVSWGASEFGAERSLDEAIKLADQMMYASRR